jgi:hypothetical protein
METIYNIYKITDRTNNKVYIGQTKRDIYKRFAEHINKALNSKRKNDKALALYIAISNHKPENFYVELLEKVEGTPKEVDNREIHWIKQYDSTNPDKGYNLDKGGHIISEACRKAAEKHLFKAGDKLEGKLLENARNNGYKVAKRVLQFSKDGRLLKEYPSIIEASRATGCDRRSIQRQLNNEGVLTPRVFSNLKYFWAYPEDTETNFVYYQPKWDTKLNKVIKELHFFDTEEEMFNYIDSLPVQPAELENYTEKLVTSPKLLEYFCKYENCK